MTIETALYPSQLNTAWPAQSDIVREGAGHLRLLKIVEKTTFPNVAGAILASHIELNYTVGATSPIQAQINAKGAIAGQTWSGTHVFPSTTSIGTVTAAEIGYLGGVTSAIQGQINGKASLSGATYTGAHDFSSATGVTLPANSSIGSITSTELAYVDGVTAPIQGQLDLKADITGESYSGTHDFTGGALKAPTMAGGTATTDVATTAFVASAALSTALPGQTGNAGKFVTTDGANASWDAPFLLYIPVTGTSQAASSTLIGRYGLQNAASTTLTLPAAPADGFVVGVQAVNLRTDNIVARNGNNINGLAEDLTVDNPHFPLVLQFRTGYGWRLIA